MSSGRDTTVRAGQASARSTAMGPGASSTTCPSSRAACPRTRSDGPRSAAPGPAREPGHDLAGQPEPGPPGWRVGIPAASSGPAATEPTAIASTPFFIAAMSVSRWPRSSATVSRLAAAGALVNDGVDGAGDDRGDQAPTGTTSSGSTQR